MAKDRPRVMVNVTWPGPSPSLGDIAAACGVPIDAFDARFGVIEVTPEEHVYTVRVDATWANRMEPAGHDAFPEVRIAPFGPEDK